jgi:uncharacterized membrane protein
MESRAKALGHSIHPMLVVFPLGLLITAVIFDILYLVTNRDGFSIASAYAIAAGVVGGLVAAVFGLVDWLAVPPNTRAKRIGLWHGLGNVVVVLFFAVSWLIRVGEPAWHPGAAALVFGFLGLIIGGVTAWMGGELVERLGIGVAQDAHPDAPSSLGTGAMSRIMPRRG